MLSELPAETPTTLLKLTSRLLAFREIFLARSFIVLLVFIICSKFRFLKRIYDAGG